MLTILLLLLAGADDPHALREGELELCGGRTERTQWRVLHLTIEDLHPGMPTEPGALYIDVDTSHCHFRSSPVYVADIIGSEHHRRQLMGTSSVSKPTAWSFRLIVLHPTVHASALLNLSKTDAWQVSWVGALGYRTGVTPSGEQTMWRPVEGGHQSLFVDVDTTSFGFEETPSYFTTLMGDHKHWQTQGVHSVFFPQVSGFRVYLHRPTSLAALTPAEPLQLIFAL